MRRPVLPNLAVSMGGRVSRHTLVFTDALESAALTTRGIDRIETTARPGRRA